MTTSDTGERGLDPHDFPHCEPCALGGHDECIYRSEPAGGRRVLMAAIFGENVTECCCEAAEFGGSAS